MREREREKKPRRELAIFRRGILGFRVDNKPRQEVNKHAYDGAVGQAGVTAVACSLYIRALPDRRGRTHAEISTRRIAECELQEGWKRLFFFPPYACVYDKRDDFSRALRTNPSR